MDILSIIGLAGGLAAVMGSMALDGGNLTALLQISAFVIVVGGTIGAVLLQTPMPIFLRGLKMFSWIFFPPKDEREERLKQITDWLRIARHQFVLALDPVAEQQTDPFIRQGLRLVVDGVDASQIRVVLESVIATVMSHLDDPSKLGNGIATAFVATVYGVAGANLLCLPVAGKLKFLVRRRIKTLEMITEGMVGIAILESPLQLEMRLRSYLDEGAGEASGGAGDRAPAGAGNPAEAH